MASREGEHAAREPESYEIEKLIKIVKKRGKELVQVRWAGYGEDDDTWEPVETLPDSVAEELRSLRAMKHRRGPPKNFEGGGAQAATKATAKKRVRPKAGKSAFPQTENELVQAPAETPHPPAPNPLIPERQADTPDATAGSGAAYNDGAHSSTAQVSPSTAPSSNQSYSHPGFEEGSPQKSTGQEAPEKARKETQNADLDHPHQDSGHSQDSGNSQALDSSQGDTQKAFHRIFFGTQEDETQEDGTQEDEPNPSVNRAEGESQNPARSEDIPESQPIQPLESKLEEAKDSVLKDKPTADSTTPASSVPGVGNNLSNETGSEEPARIEAVDLTLSDPESNAAARSNAAPTSNATSDPNDVSKRNALGNKRRADLDSPLMEAVDEPPRAMPANVGQMCLPAQFSSAVLVPAAKSWANALASGEPAVVSQTPSDAVASSGRGTAGTRARKRVRAQTELEYESSDVTSSESEISSDSSQEEPLITPMPKALSKTLSKRRKRARTAATKQAAKRQTRPTPAAETKTSEIATREQLIPVNAVQQIVESCFDKLRTPVEWYCPEAYTAHQFTLKYISGPPHAQNEPPVLSDPPNWDNVWGFIENHTNGEKAYLPLSVLKQKYQSALIEFLLARTDLSS
ncbi:chromo domain protein [Gregarina niphandrodes]|uniref:Chromo domain protein n=1 Tax=Gregarina niphandrodes TaxID=110365 RepID=A0A023AXF0_GRENI|nr:chromo domain protein [Gregarina niphandrodes]EZG43302.1 chromo domain protein [Gregarina niphandrodes]|eukprot:XP_011133444.1 chromo domain protein [Gregarina niphandrodes]